MATPDWYRSRHYLHFDRPLSYASAEKASRSSRVATHAFYPLISYEVKSKKIFRNKITDTISTKEKDRPIAYAGHLDSHIYSRYAWEMNKLYEAALVRNELTESVLAFRSLGKDNIDFAYRAFQEIRSRDECCAIALDVTGFFDNLDHGVLKSAWCSLLGKKKLPPDHYSVFKSISQFATVSKLTLFEKLSISKNNPKNGRSRVCTPSEFREKVRSSGLVTPNTNAYGIPQGTPISALLSNIYMLGFDMAMSRLVKKLGGIYYRYCDDMLFIVPTAAKSGLADEVQTTLNNFRLSVNSNKTEIRCFWKTRNGLVSDKPLQYLGFVFDGETILIRSASLARYSEKMRRGVKFAKATMIKRNALRKLRGESDRPLFKRKLYERYSHLGSRNFVRYGLRAAEKMDSQAIRKQLKPLWKRLRDEVEN